MNMPVWTPGLFSVFPFDNKATMNVHVLVFLWTMFYFLLGRCQSARLLGLSGSIYDDPIHLLRLFGDS